MCALDARHVKKTGGATDQRAARKSKFRHRLETAIADRTRAIGNAPAAFQDFLDFGMRFPALQLFERRQIGVGIIQPDNKAQRDLIIGLMIEKRTAIGIGQWPTLAVDNPAC